jgi:hypothetical protein
MAQVHAKKKNNSGANVSLDPAVRADIATLLSEVTAPASMSEHRQDIQRQLVALENLKAADSALLTKEIQKVLGAINKIPRTSDESERPFKTRAITLATAAIQAHSSPRKQGASVEQCQINDEIVKQAIGDTSSFMRWLKAELNSPRAKEWNTVNLATACYSLSRRHDVGSNGSYSRAWFTMGAEAFETAIALAERLSSRSRNESCNGQSAHNICRTLPHITTALSLSRKTSGDVDARFINTLTSIVESSHGQWERQYIGDMIFNPLSETKSVYLSVKGKEALCRYAAALHSRLSSEADFDMIRGVGDSFRSLRGITCWCDSPHNQLALQETLKPLNDRLEHSRGIIDSKAVVTILGGLRGIDYPKLTEPALSEVARTLNLVNSRLSKLTGELNYQAVCTAIYSLGVATDVMSGPLHAATSRLLNTINDKLPRSVPETLVDLGTVCSALYTLEPTDKTYSQLKKRLWQRVDNTDFNSLEIPYDVIQKVTAWSLIHQTFAVYGYRQPTALEKSLRPLQTAVDRQTQKAPSHGEARAKEVLSCSPDIKLFSTAMLAGFELDIPARRSIDQQVFDFEIDGPHHDEPCQQRSDRIRDKFLRKNNINTVRIKGDITDENITEAASRAGITVDTTQLAVQRASTVSTA